MGLGLKKIIPTKFQNFDDYDNGVPKPQVVWGEGEGGGGGGRVKPLAYRQWQ